MATTAPVPPRKARPPTSIGSVLPMPDRHITVRAVYEFGNGKPVAAIVLPVQMDRGRWTLVDDEGEPVTHPTSDDITEPTATATEVPGADPAVTVLAPWPARAPHALVLLLHSQIDDVGDAPHHDFKRLNFRGYELSIVLPDGIERLLTPALEEKSDLRLLLCQAVAAYLHKPQRNDSGVLAMPSFESASPMSPPARAARGATTDARAGPGAPAGSGDAPRSLLFALASCQYPAGIVDGSFERPGLHEKTDADIAPADRSLWRLARRFEGEPELAFTVLAGDQIYTDATAGLFDARTLLDGLNFAYARVRASQGMERLTRFGRGGIVALMDDHEVTDNWEPLPSIFPAAADPNQENMEKARDAFVDRQRAFWWPFQPPLPAGPELFGDRVIGGFPFFLADTRTERDGRSVVSWEQCRIMGPAQHRALAAWMQGDGAASTRPAFIVSPSILLPRPLSLCDQPAMALHVDSWCGYPRSLHEMLAWAFETDARHLVFLSGDEHLACLARITLGCDTQPGRLVTVHSVHAGGLYAPYPFANAIREDFADDGDTFPFSCPDAKGHPRQYTCTVDCYFPGNGDGFTLVRVDQDSKGWSLTVEFDGENGRRTRSHRL